MTSHEAQAETSTQEVLAGLIERVTYHNAENGFCVLRAKARGHRDVVTVVGHAAAIAAGEWITASGEWVNDGTHGQQFKARFLRTSPPTSADGIEKYLSSGMIRGVGPVYAKKFVRAFGEKVFDVIEGAPDRLREMAGIGQVRAASILAAWAEQKAVREIMVFLHSHGVGTARAVRIVTPWIFKVTLCSDMFLYRARVSTSQPLYPASRVPLIDDAILHHDARHDASDLLDWPGKAGRPCSMNCVFWPNCYSFITMPSR